MKSRMIMFLLCLSAIATQAQEIKFGKISNQELEEKSHPKDSIAEAAYLYKNQEMFIEYDNNQGWMLITLVHKRIKIYKKEAAKYAVENVSLYGRGGTDEKISNIKAYTYNLEGGKVKKTKLEKKQIFKEQRSRNWSSTKFTMPNIKDGSVVEWKYRKASPYFQNIDVVEMQHSIPVNKLDVLVKIPEYFRYKVHYKGFLQSYFKQEAKNKRIRLSYRSNGGRVGGNTTRQNESIDLRYEYYSLNKENIPAFDSKEPFISSVANYISSASFELQSVMMPRSQPRYFATSWEDMAKRIFKSAAFGEELTKTGYYKKELASVIAGKASEQEKAMAIYQFVKSKMKWDGTIGKYTRDGVRKAFKNSTGNVAEINLMLTSMMRSAGLNANPVLVSTRANGTPLFPTLDGFNYVVSSVIFSDDSYALLDATDLYSMPNLLPPRTVNWSGRMVKKDGTSISINLVPSNHSIEDNTISIKLGDDGLSTGIMRTKLTNYNAYNFRNRYNHVKDSEVQTKFEEQYNIEIENYRVTNKNNGKPINRLMKFSSEDLVESIGGKLYVESLLFLTNKTNPFKSEERKFPVDFLAPWRDKNTISIVVPQGYKVESIPETTAISMADNVAVFKFQAIQTGNKVKVISIVQFNRAVISPDYYLELKEFYNRIVKKQSEKIVLVKE
jgi:transglutaminase-like putative cysteine protease